MLHFGANSRSRTRVYNGINTYVHDVVLRNTGGTTVTNGLMTASTGTTGNSAVFLSSLRYVRSNPGNSYIIRYGAYFSPAAVGCTQLLGAGTGTDGVYFGYQNSTTFGITRQYGGKFHMQSWTISAGATAAGNITFTLNGIATTVAVTTGQTIYGVVQKIASTALSFNNSGNGWTIYVDNYTVYFMAMVAEPRNGTYTFAAGTTGVTVSVTAGTTYSTGISPTYVTVPQTSWNLDRADGSSTLPALVFQYGQMFHIEYQLLGFGNFIYSITNPNDGTVVPVHVDKNLNTAAVPSLNRANFPLYITANNTTGTTSNNVSVSVVTSSYQSSSKYNYDSIAPNFSFAFNTGTTNSFAVNTNYVYGMLRNDAIVGGTTTVTLYIFPL